MNEHLLRKIVGLNIKRYRFSIKLTQEKLAERCNLSPRYISDIENGNGNISIDTVENVAKALKVEPHLLFRQKKNTELPKRVNMKRK